MAEEAKIILKGEDQVTQPANAADKAIEALTAAANRMAEAMGGAGKKTEKSGDAVEKLGKTINASAGREQAEKILSIAGNLEHVGDIMAGIASGDAQKFATGMQGALHAVVSAVGLVAPQFAPVVAVLGVVISKVAEWAFGMKDAQSAIEDINKALDAHVKAIDRKAAFMKAAAMTDQETFEAEQWRLKKRVQDLDVAVNEMIANEQNH